MERETSTKEWLSITSQVTIVRRETKVQKLAGKIAQVLHKRKTGDDFQYDIAELVKRYGADIDHWGDIAISGKGLESIAFDISNFKTRCSECRDKISKGHMAVRSNGDHEIFCDYCE